MRLLLNIQVGCTNYDDLRTIDGKLYDTFHDACFALGLLSDDREFVEGIKEAVTFASGSYLRKLFVTLLLGNTMTKPYNVWQETWQVLADGILYDIRKQLKSPQLQIEICKLQQLCLIEIEKLLVLNGRSLKDFDTMPFPQGEDMNEFGNILLFNELNHDVHQMQALHDELLPMLNHDQKKVYDEITTACYRGTGGFFFVYGYGGTGKTFLWKTLSYKLLAKRKIVINVASSGIASLLLPGGKTAHSQFSIPLVLNEDSCCFIKQGSLKVELLQHASLIIWDEAPMVNK